MPIRNLSRYSSKRNFANTPEPRQTTAAPYSLRAFQRATVSAPLDWRELTSSSSPARYHLRSIGRRIAMKGDLWEDAVRRPSSLRKLEAALKAMALSAKKIM